MTLCGPRNFRRGRGVGVSSLVSNLFCSGGGIPVILRHFWFFEGCPRSYLFACVDTLRPSQHVFSYVGMSG